jgi:hypothetical protein
MFDRRQVVVAVFTTATAAVGTIAVAIVVIIFTAVTAVGVAVFIGVAIDAVIGTVAAVLIPFLGVVIGAVFFQLPINEGLKVLLTIGQGGVVF